MRCIRSRRDLDMKPSKEVKRPGTFEPATRAHIRNFLECIKTRKDPNATVEMGQLDGGGVVHGDGSATQGRRMRWDGAKRNMV